MVDLEQLASRARRAAEWGRLRAASRIAIVVVPLAGLAFVVGGKAPAVIGIGAALLALCIGLGWWSGEGARAARSGLSLGAIPMTASLLTVALGDGVEGWCDPNRRVTLCGFGCLLAGVLAGGGSSWHAMRTAPPRRLVTWSQIGLVASVTTALGCVGLGLGSALAVVTAVVAGAAVAWIPVRARG